MPPPVDLAGIVGAMSDIDLLDLLTAPTPLTAKPVIKRRDADLDPLLLAAAFASGPQVTRNHYAHDFYPAVGDPRAEGAWDWTHWQAEDPATRSERKPRLKYVSRQKPRRERLKEEGILPEEPEKDLGGESGTVSQGTDSPLLPDPNSAQSSEPTSVTSALYGTLPMSSASASLEVKCMARTRVPTPHGPVFLHLYHNNQDNKEHLAIVVDPAQLLDASATGAPHIRSHSLDAVWSAAETDAERITRGAYVGRLSPTSHTASRPDTPTTHIASPVPPPLVRIHSECFTGETIGSMRCDCGEQLDTALAQIAAAGRGAVVYMRQEGRGIGLLAKLRAYNLQDLGHDTVSANLALGHGADERGYEIAGAVLRDLGLAGGVRLLTNNPTKVRALEEAGVHIAERVPMVPRSWQRPERDGWEEGKGAAMLGGRAVYGEDLDKYLRTKVLRMGHLLELEEDA